MFRDGKKGNQTAHLGTQKRLLIFSVVNKKIWSVQKKFVILYSEKGEK